MNKVKHIIIFILFLSAFLFIGESYTFYLENFQSDYIGVNYYLETGDLESEMNNHIYEQASTYNTSVFAIDKIDKGAFERKIVVYGDEEVFKTLENDWNISEKTVKSFFSGTTTFEFEPFYNADERVMSSCYYVNTTDENIHDMLYPNMVEYSGSIKSFGDVADGKYVVMGIFSIVLCFVILLTVYDISYNKKEVCIQILHGSSASEITRKKVIIDFIAMFISSIIAFLIASLFTISIFEINTSIFCITLILALNSTLIIFCMKHVNPHYLKSIKTQKITTYSMIFKCVVSILSVIVLSSTIGLIVEGVKLYNQSEHYKSQESIIHIEIKYPYDYSKFMSPNDFVSPTEQVFDNFMIYSYKHLDCSLLYHNSYKDVAKKYGDKYVYANLQGLSQYKEFITDFEKLTLQEGNYVLVSDKANIDEVISEIPSITGVFIDELDGIITYKDGLSVIAEGRLETEQDYTYTIKNPVIFLDTYDYGKLKNYSVSYSLSEKQEHKGIIYNNSRYLYQFISVNDDENMLSQFPTVLEGEVIKPALVEISTTNIGDWFDGLWQLQNRSLLIAIVLTILLLILEIQTAILVLRMFYETNAKELTIKKVLGYSLFDRFKIVFLITGFSFVIASIVAFILSVCTEFGVTHYILAGNSVVLLVDIILALYLIRKMDRLQIQKAIKGGI